MADTDDTVQKQRDIQQQQDAQDRQATEHDPQKPSGETPALHAGAREHPAQLPAQHLDKPGHEADLQLQPQFLAPDYLGSDKLKDRVALITGADSGIGRAVAVLFAREGADVAIVYLDEHEDARKTRECIGAEGQRCLLLPGDVKDPAFCKEVVDKTVETFGKLDVLVNNAAFQEHDETLEDLTEKRFDETLRTNVYGYFHMAKAALPHLRRGASIINTGSVTGLEGSKTQMKRAAQPEELSPAYVFLAAPVCSGYITGIVLPVTGSVGAI